ncbi:MAG: family transcriptional regulator, cyclic receptor protein [Thermoleophilaceae bacterium]|nr:family transcriptional regulator, cyclic receptor protein [Thermoleophilaceae bacterium]
MDYSSFFDYPAGEGGVRPDSFVLLAQFTSDEWAKLLAFTETRRFEAGDDVIRAGDGERALYLITDGTLELLLPGREGASPLRTLDAPSVIGEMAFFDGRPRSMTVRAHTGGEARRLSRQAFEAFAVREPALSRALLLDLARILSLRVRLTDALLQSRLNA